MSKYVSHVQLVIVKHQYRIQIRAIARVMKVVDNIWLNIYNITHLYD